MTFTARSLKAGSGVKCIYDEAFQPDATTPGGVLLLDCATQHSDFELVANSQFFAMGSTSHVNAIVVQDSMEFDDAMPGQVGIIDSWTECFNALSAGRNVSIDLSLLRSSGSVTKQGHASGPASFAEIYEAIWYYCQTPCISKLLELQGVLNSVILRGGYKRGIITTMMHQDCSHIDEYIATKTTDLLGSHKKGYIVDKTLLDNKSLLDRIIAQVNSESAFLQKDLGALFSNVCVGILLRDRCTCLIWRVNVSLAKTKQQLKAAFELATMQVLSLHHAWRDASNVSSTWASLADDRQVAIDVLGLANLLAAMSTTFAEAEAMLRDRTGWLYEWFSEAYAASTKIADEWCDKFGYARMERLHTVEPSQNHAFQQLDLAGMTTCRGIWPPFKRIETRYSETQNVITVNHGNVQTVLEVGSECVFKVNESWMNMMNEHGRPHCISMDLYEKIDEKWFDRFFESSLLTTYYQFADVVNQDYARKRVMSVEITECSVCAE